MTFLEVTVVVVCLLIVAALLMSSLADAQRRTGRMNCASNLREMNVAFRIWEGDSGNLYPMAISVTNGGAKELIETGNLVGCLQVISKVVTNELATTKFFVCPDDPSRTFATNWNDLNSAHVSYFLSANASNDTNSETVFSGDDNLAVGGKPVGSGLFELSSNALVDWAPGRHIASFRPHFWSFPESLNYGNVGFADGHVEEPGPLGLKDILRRMDPATNRIVMP
jgi:prepilin-type processing-associated H-X9-DG protein